MKIGIDFDSARPTEEVLKLGRIAEAYGVDDFWVSDAGPIPPYGDTFVTLTALATITTKGKLGTAVCTPYTRHPSQLASAALALNVFSGGRMLLGIGPGGPSVLARMGLKAWNKPIQTIREAIEVLRKLFSGEKVSFKGVSFTVENVRFERAGHRIPIYVSARHKSLLTLIGEIADGSIIDGPHTYLPTAINQISEGAKKAKRDMSEVDVGYIVYMSAGHSSREAMDAARKLAPYQIAFQSPMMLEQAGITPETRSKVREVLEKKGIERLSEAASLVTDEMLDNLAIAGNPSECIEKCARLEKIGVNHLMVHWPYGPDENEGIRLIARDILPALRTA